MRKGELTRQSILEQAARVASRLGLSGLTIGTLAEQTQLSKSGLFAHFRSKEVLQLQVLEHATACFIDAVMRPTLGARRGEPRLRTLFERWLTWCEGEVLPGGCLFMSAASELDDQPGPVRDRLVRDQRDLQDSVGQILRGGIAEAHLRADLDQEQFAHDLHGIMLAFSFAHRLMKDPKAKARARRAFEALLASVKTPKH